jgi:hypothetical protein
VTQSQSVCVEEHSTRHYRGRWRGFGPVRDREHVLYAVFAATSRNDGRLTAGSFTKNLNDCTESIARRQYVTIRTNSGPSAPHHNARSNSISEPSKRRSAVVTRATPSSPTFSTKSGTNRQLRKSGRQRAFSPGTIRFGGREALLVYCVSGRRHHSTTNGLA